tara:strand:- start:1694 stop:2350 length:657 start_codon:yes stop_codon:yes gene_type:complete
MARLFVGQRENDFFADITKEVIKDVAGQKIYYYTVRNDLTDVHSVYEESLDKIFNPPIEIECLVEWQPSETKTTKFGTEYIKTLSIYMQNRDLLDRNIDFKKGDYFSYGSYFFESTSIIYDKLVYGQIERVASVKVTAKQTRLQHINVRPHGPIDEVYSDKDAIQTTFEQQRGTTPSDIRRLRKDGILEEPITGPKKVAPDGTTKSVNGIGSSFYGDE